MSLYREHGSGAMRSRSTVSNWAAAWALALGLLALGAALDHREDAMNLNTPAIEQGPLTADDLANWRAMHECCAMRVQPAEAATEIGAEPPRGKHREGVLTGLWLRLRRALN